MPSCGSCGHETTDGPFCSQCGSRLSSPEHGPPSGEGTARFGPYRIVDEVARGGMGVVYEAVQESLGRRVALKVLLRDDAPERHLKRFEREVRAIAALRHPHIVTIYETGEVEGRPFIAMEFLEGWPLDQLIREGLAWDDVAAIVRDCARAMDYAHGEGILHRDIKPANVIVSADRMAKLTDFGLAKSLRGGQEKLTRTGSLLGTPYYMAPEQLGGGHDDLDGRADVYGLGVMLYEGLTGQVPHEEPNLVKLVRSIESGPPPDPSSLQGPIPREEMADWEELDAIVARAIVPDRDLRYPTAGHLADDLDALLEGMPSSTTIPVPTGPSRRPIGWIAAAVVAAVVGVGALAAGIAWLVAEPEGSPPPASSPGSPEDGEEPGPSDAALSPARQAVLASGARLLLEDRDGTVDALGDLVETAPDHPARLVVRSAIDRSPAALRSVRDTLDEMLARSPDDAPLRTARAWTRLLLGDAAGARDDASAAAEASPPGASVWARILEARALHALGSAAAARAAAHRALEHAPDHPLALHALARSISDDGGPTPPVVLRRVDAALETRPDDPVLLLARARLLVAADRPGAAEETCSDLLRDHPSALATLRLRGRIREDAEQPSAALHDYRNYLDLGGRDPEAAHRAARLVHERDRVDEARELLERALELDPGHLPSRLRRAEWSVEAGDPRTALDDLERAIELGDPNPTVWALKGRCHYDLGEHAEAERAYARSLEIRPRVIQVHVDHSTCLMALDRFEEARAELAPLLRREPRHPHVVLAMLRCLTEPSPVQDLERAAALARRALEVAPESDEAHLLAARYQEVRGNQQRALELLQEGLSHVTGDSVPPDYREMVERLGAEIRRR